MPRQAHIVDFEEAKSSSRARAGQRRGSSHSRSSQYYRSSGAPSGRAQRTRVHSTSDWAADLERELDAVWGSSSKGNNGFSAENDVIYGAEYGAAYDGEQLAQCPADEVDDESGVQPVRRRNAFQQYLHDARKRKAQRRFDREVKTEAAPTEAGPRAALYRGEMGTKHRKAVRMQDGGASRTASVSKCAGLGLSLGDIAKGLVIAPIALAICLALCGIFLYAPARDYYIAMRDQAKLDAEYAVVSQENARLNSTVAALGTNEGMEDAARMAYGLVRDDEIAVHVDGLSPSSTHTEVQALTPSADIEVPTTWYSGVLDGFFGYVG